MGTESFRTTDVWPRQDLRKDGTSPLKDFHTLPRFRLLPHRPKDRECRRLAKAVALVYLAAAQSNRGRRDDRQLPDSCSRGCDRRNDGGPVIPPTCHIARHRKELRQKVEGPVSLGPHGVNCYFHIDTWPDSTSSPLMFEGLELKCGVVNLTTHKRTHPFAPYPCRLIADAAARLVQAVSAERPKDRECPTARQGRRA